MQQCQLGRWLVSKPHLEWGTLANTAGEVEVWRLMSGPWQRIRLWSPSPTRHLSNWSTVRHLVQHEGPGIQILFLFWLRGWNRHAVRLSAPSVVWGKFPFAKWFFCRQTPGVPATVRGRREGVEEGEICAFQPEAPSPHRCVTLVKDGGRSLSADTHSRIL